MMTLYSGITDPFSHRCRIVLYEKGMDFEIIDVDLMNKPEDLAVMNPYNRTPVLVERDLVLYESNIINEYIDERFPHPQLMPADPVMRARARLFLFRFEQELFNHVPDAGVGHPEGPGEGAPVHPREPDPDRPHLREAEIHAGRGVSRCWTWPSPPCSGASTTTRSSSTSPPRRCCKYAERLFSRQAFIDSMTASEKAMRR
jgi:RNA polymerase-associated protein